MEIFKAFRIHLLDGHYPLYGYASDETDAPPQVYFWHGEADAIGWYKDNKGEERYIIVDWKVLDILNSWEKNKNAFGKYLHQCLIYARLLQLHMDLDYLPHILIVPTGSIPGKTSTLRCFGITLSGVNKRLKVPSSLSHRQSLQWMYVDKGHF